MVLSTEAVWIFNKTFQIKPKDAHCYADERNATQRMLL